MTVHAHAWEVRRSEFNHDWLKNKYLNSLSAFIKRCLKAKIVYPERLTEFVSLDMPQWAERLPQLKELVASFQSEMSPRTLFCQPPLNVVDDHTKQWLGRLAHGLWLSRCDIQTRTQRLLEAIDRVDRSYESLSNDVSDDGARVEALMQHLTGFCEFRDALVQLSEAISDLPHRVMVT